MTYEEAIIWCTEHQATIVFARHPNGTLVIVRAAANARIQDVKGTDFLTTVAALKTKIQRVGSK
jgi:hypothetical protein